MAFNVNEVIIDRVRSMTCHDLETKEMLMRLTSLEDSSLQTSAEGEEIVDSIGAPITTLYRAKKATFSASNSLMSFDLAAAQFGAKKEVAGDDNVMIDYTYEVLPVVDGKITLSYKVVDDDDLQYVYSIADKQIGTTYKQGAVADGGFVVGETTIGEGDDAKTVTQITMPDGVTGKFYVEYNYSTTSAVKVVNKASEFPQAVSVVIYAYFRDVCNENKLYSGKIICPKAKLNPESIELALTSTGKHPFEFVVNRDYCAEEGEDTLFEIILSE